MGRAARAIAAAMVHAALAGAAAAAAPGPLEAALAQLHGADLVVIDPAGAGRPPSAQVALRVHAAPARVRAVLLAPGGYGQAVPALIRSQVIARRRRAGAAADEQQLVWELEIPLFNLEGRGWVSQTAAGAQITLDEGDLAPAKLSFSWTAAAAPGPAGAETILALEAQINVRAAGWLFRRVVSRSPYGESAMNASAAWVVLRAIAALAEHPDDPAARRPRAAAAPPPVESLDGADLAGAALGPFRARGVVGAVRRAPSGRLASVAIAVPVGLPPPALGARLAAPPSWRAFPGWNTVTPLPSGQIEVRDDLPFVDFDAVWQPRRAPPLRAVATDGATRGALFGWDVRPADGDARASLAVLSLYPRLEAAGYVPRKFIAAEPLLEHGMALALAYADAMSMKRSLETPATTAP
jgi:hypothetical protein